jgi:hypothetical protein
MRRLFAALLAAGMGLAGNVYARPVVIEPSARLPAPPAAYQWSGDHVAIDGDYALMTAYRQGDDSEFVAALVYRRTSGGWIYESILYETEYTPGDIHYVPTVAMRDGLAALNFGGIFRRTGGTWVREAVSGGRGPDIEYDNGRFVFGTGEGDWGANVAERDAGGTWRFSRIQGPARDGDNDNNGGPLDISGNTVAIAAPDVSEGAIGGPHLYRYRGASGWGFHSRLPSVTGVALGEELALRGNELFVDSFWPDEGTYLFRDEYTGANADWNADWRLRQRLQTADSFMSREGWGSVEKSPDFVFQHRFSHDLGRYVYHVFRANEEGRYEHVATLATADGTSLGYRMDVDGRRIIVGSPGYSQQTGLNNNVHIFELPEEGPYAGTVIMDQFVGNSASSYVQTSNSDFVLATDGSRTVFRQRYLGGDARAIHGVSERGDGGIQVDVRPRAFEGNDRWFGLVTRYTDDRNYYYVTVRSSGRVDLRRMSGGVFTTLATAPLNVTLLRNYRLRLESVGAVHRVFIDDRLLLQARDATFASGRLGLMTYRASADFDNLVITPNGYTTIYANAFAPGTAPGAWTHTGPGSWSVGSAGVYAQNSVAGDARAIIGSASAEDQSVTVRMRATAFAVPSGQSQRWVGVLLRYVDDQNYVYVSLRSSNTVSLRRLVNGQIEVLAEAPLTVTPGAWYTVRAEALLHATRVYVNGELVLEGPNHWMLPHGQTGLVTYRAAAEFDDFLAYQP